MMASYFYIKIMTESWNYQILTRIYEINWNYEILSQNDDIKVDILMKLLWIMMFNNLTFYLIIVTFIVLPLMP